MFFHRLAFSVLLLGPWACAWPTRFSDINSTSHLDLVTHEPDASHATHPNGAAHIVNTKNTSHLDRRQCVRRSAADNAGFDCDFRLPSVDDIVEQLQNPHNGQGVNVDRPAVFYSNLRYPVPERKDDSNEYRASLLAWVGGWLKQKHFWNGDDLKFYWSLGPFDTEWLDEQERFINANSDAFEVQYPTDFMPTEDSDGEEDIRPIYLFNHCYYQALGRAAMHQDAYIFAPKGSEWWRSDSDPDYLHVDPQPLKYKREHPDPDPKFAPPPVQPPAEGQPPSQCEQEKLDEPTILWSRARGDLPRLFDWICPVGVDLIYPPRDAPPQDEPGQNGPPQTQRPRNT
ncbi:uncharacterized protein AB675_8720 [Cyphellophora attinorum]|uniref:Uncharacterized protein n=1 Tax=Cyphellophora attinorum TaxID=1664694 RepID=A0A0N1HGI6_9EURO|nr:uncharacterized protein AB675_8720 [Phialophora attinorum]KPI44766.1 hypothetical protein AB675_8720 [Phialophora attinorum]